MDTAHEALMRAMLTGGWFIASDGDVESPTGYFGYVNNTAAELPEIFDAFSETVDTYGTPDTDDMVGSFIAWINSDGILTVHRVDTQTDARDWFNDCVAQYAQWSDIDFYLPTPHGGSVN